MAVTDNLFLYANGTANLAGGTLDAGVIDTTAPGGVFNCTSGVLHVGTCKGSLTNAGASLQPGHSAGITNVTVDYTQQAAGHLRLEIGGNNNSNPASPQFDQLNIPGNAPLAGVLWVSLINNYMPNIGETFPVVQAGAVTGAFSTFVRPVFAGGRTFRIIQSAAAVTLEVIAVKPGDMNGDGKVNILDLQLLAQTWNKNLGAAGYNPTADFNGDGSVNILDLQVMAQNWNT